MESSTTNTSSTPKGSNSDVTANQLAMAATVLAAGAFVMAFLQALMEYIGSNEARSKCTYEAIGMTAKQVKFGWNFTFWRLRVYYPLLDFSFAAVLDQAVRQTNKDAINAPLSPMSALTRRKGQSKTFGWRAMTETENTTFNDVADGYAVLVDGERRITSKDLSWREYFWLVSWKLRHPWRPLTRPRASWAQFLMAMGIRDTKELTYRHADADIIPSSIDVPIQRIKLFDLGLLALYLNFKKVHINVPERHFEAVGDFGTITTLKNELGKYIHFEGDILSINDQITKGLAFVNIMSQSSVTGRLTFGPGLSSNGIFLPLQLLPNAVADGWNEERFKLAHRILVLGIRGQDGLAKGQIAAEASLFGELYENRGRNSTAQELSERWPDRGSEAKRSSSSPTRTANVAEEPRLLAKLKSKTATGLSAEALSGLVEDDSQSDRATLERAIRHWRAATHVKLPTLIPAACLALFNGCEVGFPSRALIKPITPWIAELSREILQRSEEMIFVSRRLSVLVKIDGLNFVRSTDSFWYSYNYVGMNATYQIGLFGWVLHDIKEVYDSLDETERDEIILRDGNGQLTGDVNPVLFTDSFALLQQFNPPKWDSKIQDIVFKSMVTFRTPNLLWAQILLLDIAIHFLVRGGWHVGPGNEYNLWSTSVVSVITATVDSWDDIVKDEGTVQEKSGPSVGNPSNSVTPIVGTKLNTGAEAQGTVHAGVHGAENSLTEGQQGSRPAANGAKSSEAAGASSGATATSEKRHVRIGKASAESSESEPPPPDYSSMGLNWDLIGSLRKQAALFADLDEGLREYRLEKLATLLQLRALFFIAHKMLIPDSTDVYLAEGSNVTMPMI